MISRGVYRFDASDEALSLLPMSARRALDRSGRHLSLASWQALPIAVRQELVALGTAHDVDVGAVVRCLGDNGAVAREQPQVDDPPADRTPLEVSRGLGPARALDDALWSRLRALDRFVFAQLAGRAKLERLAAAYDEITESYGRRRSRG
ncbi:MAG TPA: nitrate reductase associated protein [Polyangiales bacterium]|nr:nitrate reductase associated protein [Polyangiales bacterium]